MLAVSRRLSPKRINQISLALLILGIGAAVAIFVTAGPEKIDPLDPLSDPFQSKKYLHEMRVIGGKSNVFAAQVMHWFNSLWHGRPLAGTVIVLTVLVVLAFRFVIVRPELYMPQPDLPPIPIPRKKPRVTTEA